MKNLKTLILLGALVFAGAARAQSCSEDPDCMNGKIAASIVDDMQGKIEKMEHIRANAMTLVYSANPAESSASSVRPLLKLIQNLLNDANAAKQQTTDASLNEVIAAGEHVDADYKQALEIDRKLEAAAESNGIILE